MHPTPGVVMVSANQQVNRWPPACIHSGIMVLICDDQPDVLVALDLLLKDSGYRARMTASPKELLSELNRRPADLILTDMNFDRDTTSGNEGTSPHATARWRCPNARTMRGCETTRDRSSSTDIAAFGNH